jgi:hypothetical protein
VKQVEQKKRPGIVERIGQVIYWWGCFLGILSVPVAVWTVFDTRIEHSLDRFAGGPGLILGLGLGAWLIGRAARNILKGD